MMRRSVVPLASGDAGTLQTINVMRGLVYHGAAHPLVRRYAVELARQTAPGDVPGVIRAIRSFLAERVHFVNDPLDAEYVVSPEVALAEIDRRYYTTGDCDDIATLGAALGAAVGIAPRFVVLGFYDPRAPMGHIYAELFDGQTWRELDTTRQIDEHERARAIARSWIVPVWPG